MTILVIYETDAQAEQLHQVMTALGLGDVQSVGSGLEGWRLISTQSYDAVVMGWTLPELSGPSMLNRIRRSALHIFLPVLIVSERLVTTDFRMLAEFPCTAHLSDIKRPEALREALAKLETEAEWSSQHVHLTDAVLELAANDGPKALAEMQEPLRRAPNPVPLGIIASRAMRERGFLVEAEAILRSLVQQDSQCVVAIHELGKVLYAQNRQTAALEQLERARRLSPHNIERLCLVGELQLTSESWEDARRTYRQALDVDPEDPAAQLGSTLSQDGPRGLISKGADGLPLSLAGMLNAEGVILARKGRCDASVTKYLAALSLIWRRDLMCRVAFNVGLTYLRARRPTEAASWFSKSQEWSVGGFEKATHYLSRLRPTRAPVAIETEVKTGKQELATDVVAPECPVEMYELNLGDVAADLADNSLLEESIGGVTVRPPQAG